ncbi:MAG: glycosyl transferase family 1, partial [Deltaproteobacteria bacterium]
MASKSNKIRIGLVGPSWPFRGGIAKFTTELAIRLEEKGHLGSFISPHRQYPRFLYPGKTDRDDSACKKLSLNRS